MSLSAWEQHTLSRIADELADSAPELMSLLSVFNRLTSGEEMPERWQAGRTGKCEQRGSRRSRRRTWTQRQASHAGRRAWIITALTLMSLAVIVVALVLSLAGHGAGTNGRCVQLWPLVCPGH